MPLEEKNPYIGPLIYIVDEAGDMERVMTIREWNARHDEELMPRRSNAELEALPVGRCPRCGHTRPLTRFDVCVSCTAEVGWDPPCEACKYEDAGGKRWRLEHGPTCVPGLQMASYVADAEAGYDVARLKERPEQA